MRIAAIVLFLVCLGSSVVTGQILLDDFPLPELGPEWFTIDTTAIIEDGQLTGFQPWGPGIFDTTSGALNMRTSGEAPGLPDGVFTPVPAGFLAVGYAPSADPMFSNGTLRAKIRVDTPMVASLNLRTNVEAFTTYNFAVSAATGEFALTYFGLEETETLGMISDLSFGVGEDWWMEASAIGEKLSMKVWKDGDVEPGAPQLIVTDTRHTAGLLGLGTGLGVNNFEPLMVNATFDDVTFTVPEPSALCLSAFGFVMLLSFRRRSHL